MHICIFFSSTPRHSSRARPRDEESWCDTGNLLEVLTYDTGSLGSCMRAPWALLLWLVVHRWWDSCSSSPRRAWRHIFSSSRSRLFMLQYLCFGLLSLCCSERRSVTFGLFARSPAAIMFFELFRLIFTEDQAFQDLFQPVGPVLFFEICWFCAHHHLVISSLLIFVALSACAIIFLMVLVSPCIIFTFIIAYCTHL